MLGGINIKNSQLYNSQHSIKNNQRIYLRLSLYRFDGIAKQIINNNPWGGSFTDMTAEIAIMNMNAIALAADSAVTISGERGKKVRTSADKIFRLSKNAPVGIMIYGAANFMIVPWEIIIKTYREQLGSKTFSTLKEYENDFINFLEKEKSLFPNSLQDRIAKEYIYFYLYIISKDIDEKIGKYIDENTKITKTKIKEITKKVIEEDYKQWSSHKDINDLPDDYLTTLKKSYLSFIEKQKKEIFSKITLTKSIDKKLTESTFNIFIKERFRDDSSGIVIAGFGDNENFPCFREIQFEFKVKGHVKYKIMEPGKISHNLMSNIAPFAQREMADTFVTGINPDYRTVIEKILSEICDSHPNVVINLLKNKINDKDKRKLKIQLTKYKKEILEGAKKQLKEFESYTFIRPVVRAVTLLNKSELAEMAESLVYLTSLKRKISPEIESVGGPTDVALISKSDGFIWIKRKHYFEKDINPQFMAKYISNEINIGDGYGKKSS